ncbi:hypothetical protein [Moraxella catarrhalis]|uniref:hypothetical protein n=1 Tax=Moraxella catarrhalis TaxID=480 RepID=UPI0018838F26|nr:hypothetical protein [Moraxella catarrhalis]
MRSTIQTVIFIVIMMFMLKGCLYAFDHECKIQEELGRQYYQESIHLQRENPNP